MRAFLRLIGHNGLWWARIDWIDRIDFIDKIDKIDEIDKIDDYGKDYVQAER